MRIAKWLGDGAMLVGVDTNHLLATIIAELHYVVCGVHAGADRLHSIGRHVGRGADLDGGRRLHRQLRLTHVAARLCDLAHAGEALGRSRR